MKFFRLLLTEFFSLELSQEEKATQTEKDHLPNTGSESQMSALAAGLALLGLGTGLAATTRKKED